MKYFKYKNNNLYCEELKVADICNIFETPFYLYSYNAIINNFNKLSSMLKGANTVIAYSVKANSNLSILKILAGMGSGADIVSSGELNRALLAKIPNDKIVYSGVGKTYKEISAALESKILQFNVESLEELKKISEIAVQKKLTANIALRVNPDISAGGHPKISTGKKTDKFGVSIIKSKEIYQLAKKLKGIRIVGVDIHIGSQILNIKPFKTAFNKIIKFTKELEADGHEIKNIDLGGGVGINYLNSKESDIFLKDYTDLIKYVSKKTNKKIIIEPGRYLLGNTGILVTKVLYKKTEGIKKFLIVDAGMNNLMRPALYNAVHQIGMIKKKIIKNYNYNKYEVVGPICETADVLVKDAKLNRAVKQDDILFIEKVGAYGSSMASSYNSKDLANEVMVNKNKFSLIRKKISTDNLLIFEKMPQKWLKIK